MNDPNSGALATIAAFLWRNMIYFLIILAVTVYCYSWGSVSWPTSHLYSGILTAILVLGVDFVHALHQRERRIAWPWWFVVGAFLSILLVYVFNHLLAKFPTYEGLLWGGAVVVFLFFSIYAALLTRGLPSPRFLVKVVCLGLTAVSIFAVFNYYKFNKYVFQEVGDHMDITYYYVNSKYFPELGYFELYPAMLQADEEMQPSRWKGVQKFRNLHGYDLTTRNAYLTEEKRAEIRGRFSDERWAEFKRDLAYFAVHPPSNGWSYFFTDHGYNPPPTWTIVGGTLANYVPVEHLKLIAMIDFALVSAMFILIAWAFGLEALIFALLWFCTTFSGRWPVLGQALLRFDWVTMLVMSVCLMSLKRHFLAGSFMMYAALNRVFPAVFFWGYGLVALKYLVQHRRLAREHVLFALGAAVMLVIVAGAALAHLGTDAFKESKENLSYHSASYTSHRVGLGDALFYRGERTTQEMNAHGGLEGKKAQIEAAKRPWLYGLFIAYLALIALFVWRTRRPVWEYIHLAMIPIFCVTNAQINYYNMRLLLVAHHASDLSAYRNKIGLMLLFAIESATHAALLLGYPRYAVTAWTSVGMCVYFIWLTLLMIHDIVLSFTGTGCDGDSEVIEASKCAEEGGAPCCSSMAVQS